MTYNFIEEYDIIVIGAGHAGVEASLAASRMGCKVLLATINIEMLAFLPCNPSIGGSAKGIVVREVDALGGEMAKNIDKSYIQMKMLNTGKGPAVRALRAQADKELYSKEMRKTVENQENLTLRQTMIDEILANSGLRLNQVDALAFGRGPGSFTGVRVGAGIAQGLALGADLPVIPISNLTAMAQAAFELHQAENVVAAIDARMNEVYFSQLVREKVRSDFGEFFQWQEIITEQVCSPEQAINQLRDDNAFRVAMSRKIIRAKVRNQLTILRRYARNLEEDINIDVQIANIKSVRSHIGECMRVSELMGYEGLISRLYFEALGKIVPSAFAFTKRTKQPPRDPFNAMLESCIA